MLKHAKDTVIRTIIHTMYSAPDNELDSLTLGRVARDLINRTTNIISTFTNYEQCKAFGKHLAEDKIQVHISLDLPDHIDRFGVYVEGEQLPKFVHKTLESADLEAVRLVDHTNKRVAVVVRMYEPEVTRNIKQVF